MASPDRIAKLKAIAKKNYPDSYYAAILDAAADVWLKMPNGADLMDSAFDQWRVTNGANGINPPDNGDNAGGDNSEYKVGAYYQLPEYGTDGKPTGRIHVAQFLGQKPVYQTDPATGKQVISGYQPQFGTGVLLQPDKPDDQFVGTVSKGGYDFLQFERPDKTTYIKPDPIGRTSTDALSAYQRAQLAQAEQDRAYQKEQNAADRTRQIQNDLDAQNQERFNRQTQDQTNAINQWIASQRQADIPQSQYQRDFEMWQNRTQGLQGPGDWINYWNAQQMPPPARPIGVGQSGVRGQFGLAENAADAAAKGYTSWVPTRQAQNMAGVDMSRQQVWDSVQHAYRPETDAEYKYRTVTQPAQFAQAGGYIAGGQGGAVAAMGGAGDREQQIATDIQAYMEATRKQAMSSIPGWANLSPNAQNNILLQFASKNMTGGVSADAQNNVNRLRELSASQYAPQFWNVGPKVPDYLKDMTTGAQWRPTWDPSLVEAYNRNPTAQYSYNPNQQGQYQVNLNTLGGKNNQVRAASAQQWQNWLPSQREGYLGLLRAQNNGRVDMNDLLNRQQQMWQASRPGQLATKVTRGY